jgi:hypothetical protein
VTITGCGATDGHPPDTGCVTCGDAAAWLRVVEVEGAEMARCIDAHGREERVATEFVGAVAPGDALLVHAGTAIHREPGAASVPAGERA